MPSVQILRLFLINRTLLKDRGPTLRVRRFHPGDREKFHGKPTKSCREMLQQKWSYQAERE
jgi:hypothetical protein